MSYFNVNNISVKLRKMVLLAPAPKPVGISDVLPTTALQPHHPLPPRACPPSSGPSPGLSSHAGHAHCDISSRRTGSDSPFSSQFYLRCLKQQLCAVRTSLTHTHSECLSPRPPVSIHRSHSDLSHRHLQPGQQRQPPQNPARTAQASFYLFSSMFSLSALRPPSAFLHPLRSGVQRPPLLSHVCLIPIMGLCIQTSPPQSFAQTP